MHPRLIEFTAVVLVAMAAVAAIAAIAAAPTAPTAGLSIRLVSNRVLRVTQHGVTQPAPDTKDWTWVLSRPCPQCGLDAAVVVPHDVPGMVRAAARAWAQHLQATDDDVLRRRPADGVWSSLEYACHARDVSRVFDERVRLMVEHDDPLFPNWDQDATALDADYAVAEPGVVAAEVLSTSVCLADRLDALTPEQWQRVGRRSDGASFTLDSLAQYLVHDVEHHLWDVGLR